MEYTNPPIPLSLPILRNPKNGDGNVELLTAFTWGPVEGANTYEFVIAEDIRQVNHFAVIDYSATTSLPGFMSRQKLKYGTKYYWEVRAVNKYVCSPWSISVFTTLGESSLRILQNRISFNLAIAAMQSPEFVKPRGQFEKAVRLFVQNPPDIENSLKDAVGALEGIANIVAGTSGVPLNTIIDKLVAENRIPRPIDDFFKKLYARRGSAPGVAHSNVTNSAEVTVVELSLLFGICANCIQYLIEVR